MPRYDVFLSHASADKPAVEYLAQRLRKEGLDPFLDKWHLVPGEPWQKALEEALDQSRTCAVFIGKQLGPWQNEEMRSALGERVDDPAFRVIPVLLPGGKEIGKEKLPRFLRRLTWVDFRTDLDDEDAFRRLLAGIRGQAPGPCGEGVEKPSLPYRCMAPAREPFVERSELTKVRDALLAKEAGRGTTVGITTAIHGAGGFGAVNAVAVLDRRRVVSGSYDGTLRVWDVESGRSLQILEGSWARAVAVLDRRRVVSGSVDWTLQVWDLEKEEVECLFTLDAPVHAVAVIPDRRIIVAGDRLSRVHFFDFVEP